jgi:hypothetical protein
MLIGNETVTCSCLNLIKKDIFHIVQVTHFPVMLDQGTVNCYVQPKIKVFLTSSIHLTVLYFFNQVSLFMIRNY